MRCPKCRHKRNDVFDSRKYLTFILRSRRCRRCKYEWKTQEEIVDYNIFIDKSKQEELNKSLKSNSNLNLFNK